MEEKKKVSEAQKRATAKYEKENYDKVLVRFPKGTKDKILQSGAKSVNGFVIDAVKEKLERSIYNSSDITLSNKEIARSLRQTGENNI